MNRYIIHFDNEIGIGSSLRCKIRDVLLKFSCIEIEFSASVMDHLIVEFIVNSESIDSILNDFKSNDLAWINLAKI